MNLYLRDTAATENFGAQLWSTLPDKCLIFLQGNLGMGKTTLVRGFLRAAGFSGIVKSPTYTLVEEYPLTKRTVLHFDLYRLNDPEELEAIGIRDYFEQDNICFIEWPEQGLQLLPPPDLIINFSIAQTGRALLLNTPNQSLKNKISSVIKQIDTDIL